MSDYLNKWQRERLEKLALMTSIFLTLTKMAFYVMVGLGVLIWAVRS